MIPTSEQLGDETQTEKLRAIFLGRPNEWIPMPELGELIGAFAVHSRVADLRRDYGMAIKARQEGRRPRKSFYLYEPEGTSTDIEGAADLGAAAGARADQ